MLRAAVIVFGFFGVCSAQQAFSQEHNPATELVVPSPQSPVFSRASRSLDPIKVAPLSRDETRRSVTGLPIELRRPQSYAEAVDTLSIKPYLLFAASADSGRLGTNSVPNEVPHTLLSIEGRSYVLQVVDVTDDPKYAVRHVTAAVVSEPGSYARFTIDDQRVHLVGALHTPDRAYRILPLSAQEQIVYRLRPSIQATVTPLSYPRVAQESVHGAEATRLEKRHRQVELLASIQPRYVRTEPETTNAVIDGGDLGTIERRQINPDTIKELLLRLSALTGAQGDESFEISRIAGDEDSSDIAIFYRQVVNGIPVAVEREIRVDGNGLVMSVTSGLVDPTYERVPLSIHKDDAIERAIASLRQTGGVDPTVTSTEVTYRIDTERHRLAPHWLVIVEVQGAGYRLVHVDGSTGAVTVTNSAVPALGEDFRQYICQRVSGEPTQCCLSSSPKYGCNAASGIQMAWHEYNDGDVECVSSICNDPSLSTPNEVIRIINSVWESAVGQQSSLCCHGIGGSDNRIDVVVGTPANSAVGAHYDPVTRNILIPPHPPGQPQLSLGRSAEVIAHELTHALQHLNFTFEIRYGSDHFGSSLMEGLADAMTATLSERITWAGLNWGEPWIVGDAPPPFGSPRDLRGTTLTFSRMFDSSLSYHERGRAAANFMYRIKDSFPSLTRFIEFQISVMRSLQDGHAPGFDLQDFRDAIDRSLKPGETAILDKINEVWAAMDDTVVVSPSPPRAPWFVDGTPLGCLNGTYSLYSLGWSHVSGATRYEIWYYFNGVPYYDATYTASPIYVWANINADMRVKACNSHGCSGLSTDGYWVIHNQCH